MIIFQHCLDYEEQISGLEVKGKINQQAVRKLNKDAERDRGMLATYKNLVDEFKSINEKLEGKESFANLDNDVISFMEINLHNNKIMQDVLALKVLQTEKLKTIFFANVNLKLMISGPDM